MPVDQVFDARVRPPYGSFAAVRMAATPDPAWYEARRVAIPSSIKAGPDYAMFRQEVEATGVTRALVAARAGGAMGLTPDNADVVALVDSDPGLYRGALALDTDVPEGAAAALERSVQKGIAAVMVEPGLAEVP